MNTTRENDMLLLASSYKPGGYCIAGKMMDKKEWVRPVSTKDGGSIRFYGNPPRPLSIVSALLTEHVPKDSQPENYLLEELSIKDDLTSDKRDILGSFVDTPSDIWSYGDKQDRVHTSRIYQNRTKKHQSLYLIYVDSITFEVIPNHKNDKKLVGTFAYNKKIYSFSVTDPLYCKHKSHSLGFAFTEHKKYLTISLGEEFYSYHYKLIAAIL